MADGSGKLKELREQMVAAAQALADERRSQVGSSPIPIHSTASGKTSKPVIDGSALRTDERQRLARERREERERLNAAREKELVEKEKKAKLQYEKQMEEKQKKLEEQRLKDEHKRTAAEEKRKQKLQEEKERRETTLRRTLERSSQLDQRQKRWSWGGSGEGDKPTNKRSTSASNLKQADSVVNKRLSSSSATLQTSSEKASATTISSTPPSVSKGPMRSRSIDRLKSPQSATSGVSSSESSQKPELEKASPPSVGKRPPSPVTLNRRSPSPASTTKRAPSPTLDKKSGSSQPQKNRPPSPGLLKQRPPSPTVTHKPVPIQRPSLTPTVLNATKKIADSEAKPKEKSVEGSNSEPKNLQASEKEATTTKTKDESSNKTVSGSTTAEEAAKILAEKRRLAREQREREEKERIQREQEEKVRQEEMARKAEEERQRMKEEAKLLEERRKLELEEEERKAEEEKFRRELEEQERLAELQQQKEEAEARALEEAEKQRQEREKIMQQNMQERLERKKRIEEIMKRTRKTDLGDAKNEERSEDDEENFSLDKNMLERVNGTDSSDDADGGEEVGVTPSSMSPDFLSPDAAAEEMNGLLMNGDKPDIDQDLNGHFTGTTPTGGFSQVANDTGNLSLDQTHLSKDDKRDELVANINGKPSAWMFEEIIDLEIHSKTSLSESTTDCCNQDFIEAATVPPKLAFEEGHVNSLSLAIETAAEI